MKAPSLHVVDDYLSPTQCAELLAAIDGYRAGRVIPLIDRAERRRSLLADLALGVVAGFGAESYRRGLEGLVGHLAARDGR